MSLSKLLAATATAAVALLASPIVAAQTSNKGLRVIGLTSDQRLVSFNSNAPKLTFKSIGTIAGLSGDTGLVATILLLISASVCHPIRLRAFAVALSCQICLRQVRPSLRLARLPHKA